MQQQARFAIVGGGKMGTAIMAGLIASNAPVAKDIRAKDFIVVNPGSERRAHLQETYGVTCVEDVSQVEGCEVAVLAVKPQVLPEVLDCMARLEAFQGGIEGPLFVSVAAGITTASIEEHLEPGSRVVRAMPNMPLVIGAGATGLCAGSHAASDVAFACELFQCLGSAVVVEEGQMDAVCALSGSGPAYVARMVEAMVEASVERGLSPSLAETLAVQTVLGTAQVLDAGIYAPTTLREAVSSPGGTTLAALDAMREAGFEAAIGAGIDAADKRSKELAG